MNALLVILHVIYLRITDSLFDKKFVTGHSGVVSKLQINFVSLKRRSSFFVITLHRQRFVFRNHSSSTYFIHAAQLFRSYNNSIKPPGYQ